MAGVIPKRTPSGRKQWTLHNGPTSSLNQLRNQLASDGDPESQVVLAKGLFNEETSEKAIRKERDSLAVYWLMKASDQGNVEATELLRKCLENGQGITEQNYMDVQACIDMSQNEKLARKAARDMFISLSNGSEYITSDQLQKRILSIERKHESGVKIVENGAGDATVSDYYEKPQTNGQISHNFDEENSSDEESTDWSLRSDSSNEKLTEDHLISAAVNYSHGHLPIVNRVMCLTEPNLKALDHIPYVHRSILHPLLAFKILYFKLIKFLGQKYHLIVPLMRFEVQFVSALFLYALFSSDNIVYFLPILMYYVSFVVMVVTTFQMLQEKRDFLDFRLWSGLFLCYSGGSLNSEQAELQYIRNNLKPYGMFFISLLCNLVIYSLIAEQWIPQSELTIASFCLTFMTLVGFLPKKRNNTKFDFFMLLSFAINVLAKYPYESDNVVAQGWRFLDLKVANFPSYVIGNGIDFCMNFRVVLYSVIPLLFIKIASRENWKGTFRVLIPHCVTLSWLQICIISSQGATMYGLLRGTLALVGTIMFLPLVGLTSALLPAAALTKWIITSNFVYNFSIFIVLALSSLIVSRKLAQTRLRYFTSVLQLIIMAISAVILLNNIALVEQNISESGKGKVRELSWDAFLRNCYQPKWQEENLALVQMNCAQLENTKVHWDGTVTDIKIHSIHNKLKEYIDKLPLGIARYFYCVFGDKITTEKCDSLTDNAKEDCNLVFNTLKSINSCSLQKFNKYTFDLSIDMPSGIWEKRPVTLLVSNFFRNFTTLLKPSDHIWFKGTLFNNEVAGKEGILGGLVPFIKITELGCIECSNNELTEIKFTSQNVMCFENIQKSLIVGWKFVLNLLFSPVFVFN